MKTQTFKSGENMIIVEGDVYLYNIQKSMEYRKGGSGNKIFENEFFGWQAKIGYKSYPVLATTNQSIQGVTHIPREWFVKGVDVDAMASDFAEKSKCDWQHEKYVYEAFKAGYNANKNEFTLEEMQSLAFFVMEYENENTTEESIYLNYGIKNIDKLNLYEAIEAFIRTLRPLSLPKSLTVTEDFKLVKIEW